ncbi:hypothetical protein [Nostoc sphaeroides]|uniref:Uncharacterized protein n=1 Tax=Nostoc sphaeroides CCNUC1 TaxID=2653204 RepID=A0A5P8WEX3_9NOSO|nr:hypothetical protein [Nostoc sphaeroides]QFS51140.1 hypothetical protein GXM_08634 [Nostoc sphaeroides CCNUC1]QFS52223.1 hypothetical protein GXM_09717 [Nostoc sphaeroides CCNUC1]
MTLQLPTQNNGTHPQKATDSFTIPQQKERLENLLYHKVQQGEDISPCIEALYYLASKQTTQDQLQVMWAEVIKERSAFNSLQRVIITAFAILGMIAFFNGAFARVKPSAAANPPAAQQR